jgi:2-C-methyl-D-erythritol 4-phosphate cytidylyltransferase
VVAISVETARSVANGVVVVVPGTASGSDLVRIGSPDVIVQGGATRSESVRAGLAAVPSEAGIVVVHDAVRPLATAALFASVVQAVMSGADAAVPGLPITDTLKKVSDDVVVSTIERSDLVSVQTPQAFRASVLRTAHAGSDVATDDAALVESLGGTVRIVPGERSNLKLTDPVDLRILEALMDEHRA